jgi:beta-glucosidase
MSSRTESETFPQGFLWGAATAAYQVEGSPLADGAGESIWHRFSHTPGMVRDGDTGDVACDHYRRAADDVGLMRSLGLQAYRFSIAWGRVLPEGTGRVNQRGLDFYRRLVDLLLDVGILPCATLYHWDLPAALDDRGGWTHRDVAGWFAEYASVMFRALGDRVPMWATLNEPWVVCDGGYLFGVLAPGRRSRRDAALASVNLMRAHGAGVQAFRALCRQRIGLVVNIEPKYPASQSPADLAATARSEAYMNRQYLDPALLGAFPEELPRLFGGAWPRVSPDDLALVRQPLDWLGVNYYTRGVVRHDPSGSPFDFARVRQVGAEHTELDWEVYPQGLTDALVWVKRRYGEIPLYITENGAAFADPPRAADLRPDVRRIEYLRRHLLAARAAIAAGVDLRGYFVWSLLDNFEWSHGYSKRFGIVHVDYSTQARTAKASAAFYAAVIRSNGASLTS